MSRQHNLQPSYEAREQWRTARRLDDPTAIFRPGEELRCPGLVPSGREVCGSSFNEFAKPHTRVILRRRIATLPELPHAGTDLRCRHCRSPLEKYTIREASE